MGNSLLQLPSELIISILGNLPADDLARALSTCHGLQQLSDASWRGACERRWPRWAAIAAQAGTACSDAYQPSCWRRQYELLSLREEEAASNVQQIRARQQVVNERHRAILTEWLCEVR